MIKRFNKSEGGAEKVSSNRGWRKEGEGEGRREGDGMCVGWCFTVLLFDATQQLQVWRQRWDIDLQSYRFSNKPVSSLWAAVTAGCFLCGVIPRGGLRKFLQCEECLLCRRVWMRVCWGQRSAMAVDSVCVRMGDHDMFCLMKQHTWRDLGAPHQHLRSWYMRPGVVSEWKSCYTPTTHRQMNHWRWNNVFPLARSGGLNTAEGRGAALFLKQKPHKTLLNLTSSVFFPNCTPKNQQESKTYGTVTCIYWTSHMGCPWSLISVHITVTTTVSRNKEMKEKWEVIINKSFKTVKMLSDRGMLYVQSESNDRQVTLKQSRTGQRSVKLKGRLEPRVHWENRLSAVG